MAVLNPDIENIDSQTLIGKLYSRLYEGMVEANKSTFPDTSEYVHEDGTVDEAAINGIVSGYSDILMKNSAYNTAKSIIETLGSGGGGGGSFGSVAVYSHIRTTEETDQEAIQLALSGSVPNEGDIAIISDMNEDSTIEYNRTCYIYSGIAWKPISGLVDAGNTIIRGNIIIDEDTKKTAQTDGSSVTELFTQILQRGDKTSIASLWNSLSAAKEYAENDATAGIGHILSVTEGVGIVNAAGIYVKRDEVGTLKRIDVIDTNSDGNYALEEGNFIVTGWASFVDKISLSQADGFVADIVLNNKGCLDIGSSASIAGSLTVSDGFAIGKADAVLSTVINNDNKVFFRTTSDIDFVDSIGISFNEQYVINSKNSKTISFSAPSRVLCLGDNGTTSISLQSDVYNDNNDTRIISKYGDGNFQASFKASCNKVGTLISTYVADDRSGVIVHQNLAFGDSDGIYMKAVGRDLGIYTFYNYYDQETGLWEDITKETIVGYDHSDSLYAPLNQDASALTISSTADFIQFNKPLEGTSIGVVESKTRITDGQLFFNDGVYMLAIVDGIKHYGNNYFVNDLSSVKFSSGFAGSGWQVAQNKLTGNIAATFDELTIRKKMRVYELEVQKISCTNGSLWVSDNCSGDEVILVE